MDEERNAQDIHLYLRHLACTYANTETPLADLEHAIEHDFNMPSGRMKGQLFALKKPLLESLLEEQVLLRARAEPFERNPGRMREVIEVGCARAREVAEETLEEVRTAVGTLYT